MMQIHDKSIQLRRFRMLPMVLWFLATVVNGRSLDIHHFYQAVDLCSAHRRMLEDRLPLMPYKIQQEWKLFSKLSPYQQNQQLESTITFLSMLNQPKLIEMLENDRRSLDFEEVHKKGENLFVFGVEQPGLTKDDLFACMMVIRTKDLIAGYRVKKPRRYLFEEAQAQLGPEMLGFFQRGRKYGMDGHISLPNIKCLRNEHLDIVEEVFQHCATKFIFQADEPESRRYLREMLIAAEWNLNQQKKIQQLHDGYKKIVSPTTTVSDIDNNNWSTKQDWGSTSTHTHSSGNDWSYGTDEAETEDERDGHSWGDEDFRKSRSKGKTIKRGERSGRTIKTGKSDTAGNSYSHGLVQGGGKGRTVTHGQQIQYLAKYKLIEYLDGWAVPKDMQESALDKLLATLPKATCIVKQGHLPLIVAEVYFLPDPFLGNTAEGRRLTKKLVELSWEKKECFGPVVITQPLTWSAKDQRRSSKSEKRSGTPVSRQRDEGAKNSKKPES